MAEESVSPFAPPKANLEGVVAGAEVRLAERSTRLVAVLLDFLVLIPTVVPISLAAAFGQKTQELGAGMAIAAAIGGLLMLGLVIYQIYLLATRGQTLGKRWMKIRIVKLDGSNPGFVSAVLLRAFVNGIISAIPYLGYAYSLVDILFVFRDDRRCIHDLIAGTRVVTA